MGFRRWPGTGNGRGLWRGSGSRFRGDVWEGCRRGLGIWSRGGCGNGRGRGFRRRRQGGGWSRRRWCSGHSGGGWHRSSRGYGCWHGHGSCRHWNFRGRRRRGTAEKNDEKGKIQEQAQYGNPLGMRMRHLLRLNAPPPTRQDGTGEHQRQRYCLIPAQVGVVQVALFEVVPVQQAVPDLLVHLVVIPGADQYGLAG